MLMIPSPSRRRPRGEGGGFRFPDFEGIPGHFPSFDQNEAAEEKEKEPGEKIDDRPGARTELPVKDFHVHMSPALEDVTPQENDIGAINHLGDLLGPNSRTVE
jgi:hypothetical protein